MCFCFWIEEDTVEFFFSSCTLFYVAVPHLIMKLDVKLRRCKKGNCYIQVYYFLFHNA